MDVNTLITLLGEAISTGIIVGYFRRAITDHDRRLTALEQKEDRRAERAMAAHGGD